jgi:HlyD family secretion protein
LRKLLLILIGLAAIVLVWFLAIGRNGAPEVPFTKVTRETIVATLPTNGKVEPIDWASARAERAGSGEQIFVQKGQAVDQGAAMVALNAQEAQADLASAQARITAARAELDVIGKGGRASDLTEIDAGAARAKLEIQNAQLDYDSLKRMAEKQAATAQEVRSAKERLDRARLQAESFEQKRGSLVASGDKGIALARLHDAEAAARLARQRVDMSTVRAPIGGTVYQFDLKKGAYLNPGDLVANIGHLERVHVTVYVDEPELGRVAQGMPVAITWDAKPGRQWKGEVEKMPTQIVALGTRQVGEVVCNIENPDRDLLPGTNINAEIKTGSAANATVVPKETIQRVNADPGLYVLTGNQIHWKKVKLGLSSTTRSQVEGVNQGESVALPSDRILKDGMSVKPVYP